MWFVKLFFIILYTIVLAVGVIGGAGMIYGGYVELTKMMEEKKE